MEAAAALADGIVLDAMVRLGHRGGGGLQRILIKQTPQMKEALIMGLLLAGQLGRGRDHRKTKQTA
jgi:hypothetical protein